MPQGWKLGIAVASMLALGMSSAKAATIAGADYGGADLVVSDGDILSGAFTNIGSFVIGAGVTVFVEQGTPLSVSANAITIDGTLDGTGSGYAGGASVPPGVGANGLAGTGPGAGEGGLYGSNVHASGGGGGAYGGNGGNSGQSLGNPPFAAGGSAYGTAGAAAADMGSGGGSAGSHNDVYDPEGIGGAGGAGGGAISLSATGNLILNGAILADGQDGAPGSNGYLSTSGGGGGSGGGIELFGIIVLNGLLSAAGGDGADFVDGIYEPSEGWEAWGQGGGGGGGGRILIAGTLLQELAGFAADVSGGTAGISSASNTLIAAEAGEGGSFLNIAEPAVVPLPAALPFFATALGGLGLIGWRKNRISRTPATRTA